MRLGLALGSGGARGWCHVGVLSELSKMGIQPDVVAGCSMGALVGAAWAADRLESLEDWAQNLTIRDVLSYTDLRFSGGGLMLGQVFRDVLEKIGCPSDFKDLKHPFIAVATDMASGREQWLREGNLFDAVRGSVSIPGLLRPHRRQGKWLLDGGLVNPVPVSASRALGADLTIAVNPNAKKGQCLWKPQAEASGMLKLTEEASLARFLPEELREFVRADEKRDPTPNLMDVISTSIDIMTEFVRTTREAGDPPHLRLDADLGHITMLELYKADEIIETGRRLVRDNADRIGELVSG